MADRNVLDLTTDNDRPVVTIDSLAYPLRTARDLTLQDFRFLERVALRVGTLLSRQISPKENVELEARLKEIAKIALDAPAPILAKLTALQRVLIFKVFTELLTPTLTLAARAIQGDQARAGSPGTKRSPGSYASTAGLLKPGRRGRRQG